MSLVLAIVLALFSALNILQSLATALGVVLLGASGRAEIGSSG
jgi:hypothetical protein